MVAWIYVKVVLAPAAVAIEQIGPWAGLRRSWRLTRGSWWRTLGVLLLVGLMIGILTSLVSGGLSGIIGLFIPTSPSSNSWEQVFGMAAVSLVISSVITVVLQSVGTAYMTLVMAVLYIDYRIRQESFDLDLGRLAAQAGSADRDARFAMVQQADGGGGTAELVPGRSTPPPAPSQHVHR